MINNTILSMAAENAQEMLIVFNCNGIITYVNKKATELLQYTDTIVGRSISDIFPEIKDEAGHIRTDAEGLMAYRENRTCFSTESKIIINNDDDEYACLAIDATEKQYLEKMADRSDQEIDETQQVKTQFVANVTHELRTPVNGILGNTRELIEKEEDEKKLKLLRLIERGCKDMHALINNILDFSKLDAGKFTLENNKFNFTEMMDYIRSTHINKITEKGLELSVNVSRDIPEFVIGDELRIQQILNNFISNAVKFTYTGRIMVEVVKTSQVKNKIELFFMVIDTGIGIAKEDQDRLFKSFSQVEASTTRKFGGTGLGLCITKQLVELMNGSVHVESEKGKGSMFSFHIWVEIPEEELEGTVSNEVQSFNVNIPTLDTISATSKFLEYGTKDNIAEIHKKLSKLILCVDMENWEKAEFFMESLKQLTADAPREIKSAILKLKMAVQRADGNKTSDAYEAMLEILPEE